MPEPEDEPMRDLLRSRDQVRHAATPRAGVPSHLVLLPNYYEVVWVMRVK